MSTSEDRVQQIDLQPSKGKCFLIPTTVITKHGKHEIDTLLDSGASGQFISPELVRQLNLPQYPLGRTINIFNADGTKNKGQQCSAYTKIKIQINNRVMMIKPKIVQLGTKPLFLGITWLREHNPDIDWENATLRWRDEDTSLNLMEILEENTINYVNTSELYEEIIDNIDESNDSEEINVKQNTS